MTERTCKDCFHYKACKEGANRNGFWDIRYTEQECKQFLPTADVVEVKHGQWIYNVKYYSCSICAGKRFNLLLGTDAEYCPYCGAKMDGTKERGGEK